MIHVPKTAFALILGSTLLRAQANEAFRRGLVALEQNQLSQALEELTAAEKQTPADARVRNFRGIVLARLGRLADAAAEYREAIRLDPSMADAFRNLGYLDWTQHHLDKARGSLASVLKLAPNDQYAHYYLGRVELESGHYAAAFAELERSHAAWPDDPDFLLAATAGYLSLRRNNDARRLLHRLATQTLSDAQSVRFGSLLVAAHEDEETLATFRSLAEKNRAAYWARFDLALANLLTGHSQAAVTEVLSLAKPDGLSAPWTLVGIAYARLGDRENSIAAFRRAAELDPNVEERWLDLTRELMERGEFAATVAEAQRGLEHNPRSYALHLRLGAAYLKSARYREAESLFRDLIAHDDPLPTSSIGLAQVLLRTGRAKEAAQELARARERVGSSFLLVYFQGIALVRAGRSQEAISEFRESVRLNPGSAEAHQWLGGVELGAGQVQSAVADLTEALRLDPNNRQARRLLSHAYAIEHQPQAASEYARQALTEGFPVVEDSGLADFFYPSWQMPQPAPH